MKIEIDKVEINGESIEAIIRLKAKVVSHSSDEYLAREISNVVVERLAEMIVNERGADLLRLIDDKQLLNAMIMRTAGKFIDR